MQLKWYGQAAFQITRSDGFRVTVDPYTPEILGYAPIRDAAELVITSSDDDEAHCRWDLVPGDPVWVNALDVVRAGGAQTTEGLEIKAVEAMEIESHPLHEPGQNAMYRFEIDGVRVAHMGDVGNPLNERQTAFFDDVDVLLALAGAQLVIGLDELKRVIDATRPKRVIPMHFRTLTYKPRNLEWIEAFLSRFDDADVDFAFDHTVSITKADLPESTRVLVMDYAR